MICPKFRCGACQRAWTATTPHLTQSRPAGGLARGPVPNMRSGKRDGRRTRTLSGSVRQPSDRHCKISLPGVTTRACGLDEHRFWVVIFDGSITRASQYWVEGRR
jgi:hypothetical protein